MSEFFLAGNILGTSKSQNAKQAKREAFELAKAELEKEAILLQINPKADQISITKDKGSISAVVEKHEFSIPEDKSSGALDSSNIGFKMMQKLGWSGGGLGTKKDGIEEPISLDFGQKTRHGLGSSKPLLLEGPNGLNKDYCRQLVVDYCNSSEIRDLKFTSAFTKEQRGYFHR